MKRLHVMSLRRQLAIAAYVVVPLLSGRAAFGQARYTATAPGAYVAVGASYSQYQLQYGDRALGGFGAHVDVNFNRAIGIEGEARWLRQNEVVSTNETTYLVGPRYQKRLWHGPLMPYAKFLVGEGIFNFPYNYAKGEYFVMAPGAGLEIRLNDAVKVRLIDFEYQRWPQFTYGTITPYGIGAGITIRVFNGTGDKYRHK